MYGGDVSLKPAFQLLPSVEVEEQISKGKGGKGSRQLQESQWAHVGRYVFV